MFVLSTLIGFLLCLIIYEGPKGLQEIRSIGPYRNSLIGPNYWLLVIG